MITDYDLQTLNKATLELYSPDLNTGNWLQHAFQFLATLTITDQINYGYLDPKRGSMDVATNFKTPDWDVAVTGFGACMAKYPYFSFDPSVGKGRPFFRSDFITARQFRDLDMFQDCFRLLGMMDHAAVHVPTNDGNLMWFGLERSGNMDFSERDRTMLELAQRHLLNSRDLARARAQMRDEFTINAEVLASGGFTPRVAEVGYWLIEGKTNVEIGILMKLQTQTVKGHLTTLFNKTGTGNRLALTLHLMELSREILCIPPPMLQLLSPGRDLLARNEQQPRENPANQEQRGAGL